VLLFDAEAEEVTLEADPDELRQVAGVYSKSCWKARWTPAHRAAAWWLT
jgi:hypothetical protein